MGNFLMGATIFELGTSTNWYKNAKNLNSYMGQSGIVTPTPMGFMSRKQYYQLGQYPGSLSSGQPSPISGQLTAFAGGTTQVWLCYQPHFNPVDTSGIEYSFLKQSIQAHVAAGLTNLKIVLWQEGNNHKAGFPTAAQFQAVFQYYYPLLHADFPDYPVVYDAGSINGESSQSAYDPSPYCDEYAMDLYWNTYQNDSITANTMAGLADTNAKPFGWGEFGASNSNNVTINETEVLDYFSYIETFMLDRLEASKPCSGIMYYESNQNPDNQILSSSDYRISTLQGMYNTLVNYSPPPPPPPPPANAVLLQGNRDWDTPLYAGFGYPTGPPVLPLPSADEPIPGVITVLPLSAFGITGDDGAVINNVLAYAEQKYGNAPITVSLSPVFQYNIQTQITFPYNGIIKGNMAFLNVQGNGGIYWHNTQTALSNDQYIGGLIEDLIIDGTNSNNGAFGLDHGDCWSQKIRNVTVQNFAGPDSVGYQMNNAYSETQHCKVQCTLVNNQVAASFIQSSGTSSMDKNDFDFDVNASVGQNGMVWNTGCYPGGSHIKMAGTFASYTSAQTNVALTLNGTHFERGCLIEMSLNASGSGTNNPQTINFNGGAYFQNCEVRFAFTGTNPWVGANLPANSDFAVKGLVQGDANLTTLIAPSVPASNSTINVDADTVVIIAGGTISAIAINGIVTGVTSGQFFIGTGGSIELTYTVAPTTWIWYTALGF